MPFQLPSLPYAKKALEPYISVETLEYHHEKHHLAYVNKLNILVQNTKLEYESLETLVTTTEGSLFNNAAQVWNHTFYFHCMGPAGAHEPTDTFVNTLSATFHSIENFKEQFTKAAMTQFGSGWAWLVQDQDNHLKIMKTANAENPMTQGCTPLLACDVWEHAYYIDTRNDRGKYLGHFWKVVNWHFVEQRLQSPFKA